MGQRQTKLLGLELLRFACALAVVIYHFDHFAQLPGTGWLSRERFPLSSLLSPIYIYGQLGVQFFWLISGFVFFWKYGQAIAKRTVSPVRFFWLRFSRLYPLHIVTLLLVAALQPIHTLLAGHSFVYGDNTPTQFALNLVMATQWGSIAPMTFNGPFWSVSAEVLVYAIFFGLVWRFGNSIMLCALTMFAGFAFAALADLPVAFCAIMFFAGGIAAHLFAEHGSSAKAHGIAVATLVVAVAIIAAALFRGVALSERMLALAVGPQLLFLGARDYPVLDRFAKPIETAGNLTYSSYMCHFPLQLMLALFMAASGLSAPVSSPLFLLAYLAVVLVTGYFVFERFERPAQDAIRHWAATRRAAATG